MFKARGTKQIFGFDTQSVRPDPEIEAAVAKLEASNFAPVVITKVAPVPDPVIELGTPADEERYADAVKAIDFDIALAMGMQPTLPPLPFNFASRVRAAYAGDLDAIKEMREIGDAIPAHMQVAFAEMVEAMLDESVAA
jgi:hypothetical protein